MPVIVVRHHRLLSPFGGGGLTDGKTTYYLSLLREQVESKAGITDGKTDFGSTKTKVFYNEPGSPQKIRQDELIAHLKSIFEAWAVEKKILPKDSTISLMY